MERRAAFKDRLLGLMYSRRIAAGLDNLDKLRLAVLLALPITATGCFFIFGCIYLHDLGWVWQTLALFAAVVGGVLCIFSLRFLKGRIIPYLLIIVNYFSDVPLILSFAMGGLMASGMVFVWGCIGILVMSMWHTEWVLRVLTAWYLLTVTVALAAEIFYFPTHAPPTDRPAFVIVNVLAFVLSCFFAFRTYVNAYGDLLEEGAATNRRLAQALEDVQSAQEQLIQSEKLASLGQLIAGIAHEINTPIGAIRASAGVVSGTLRSGTIPLLTRVHALNGDDLAALLALVKAGTKPGPAHTTSEARAVKRAMTALLAERGVPDAMRTAALLTDMDVLDLADAEALAPVLKRDNAKAILEMAFQLVGMAKGASTIEQATDKISKIVYALRNFSHFDRSGEKTPFDVREGVEVVLTLYYNQLKNGIDVRRRFGEVPLIPCYPDDLAQVWTNLVHNAVQAMQGRGILDIAIYMSEDGSRLLAEFSDSGPGVPEAIRRQIFEPFFTTKALGEGSGLGLSICRRVMEKHGGTLTLGESELGGAKFTVDIPAR